MSLRNLRPYIAAFLLAFAVGTGLTLLAQGITVPNTFTNGTEANADEVNANFAALSDGALNRSGGTMTGTLTSRTIAPVTDALYALGDASHAYTNLYTAAINNLQRASTITTTGNQTALSLPVGLGPLTIFANNATALGLQGIAPGLDGQSLTIYSIGAGNVALFNQNGSATAANRLITLATSSTSGMVLAAGTGVTRLVYDATAARWRMADFDQGAWLTPTFAAGDYTGNGAMTVTVDSGDVTRCRYYLRGRLLVFDVRIDGVTIAGTPDTEIRRAIPGGFTSVDGNASVVYIRDNGVDHLGGFADVTSSKIRWLVDTAGTAWTASVNNSRVTGTFSVEVQ